MQKRKDSLDFTKILLNVQYFLIKIEIEKNSTYTKITLSFFSSILSNSSKNTIWNRSCSIKSKG